MRVTNNLLFGSLRYQIQTSSERLLKSQEQAATQKKINHLSDNVVDAGRVVDLKGVLRRTDQYLENLGQVNEQAGFYDQTLGQINDLIGRAKELMLQETNEVTSTAATREATRVEIAMLTNQLVAAGNAKLNGQYVFSGFATETPAFADAQVGVAPAAIAGRAAVSGQQVLDATQLTLHNYAINFTAPNQYEVVDTTTGINLLSNQSYVSGQAIRFGGLELTLTDTPGAPLAGDSFAITVTPPGAYQGDSQTQQVEVQPGTRVAQNLPGDRVFQGAGVTGGANIFDLLNQANVALRDNDRPTLNGLLDQIDSAREQFSHERAAVGARVNMLESVQTRAEDVKLSLETMSSGLEDLDLADALTELQRQQTAYEATLSTASKIVQPSLLDFLR